MIYTIEDLKHLRSEILGMAAAHGAKNIRVFGSVARGDADEKSDIDFLVDLEPGKSIFDLGAFIADLKSLLGDNIDVVSSRGVKERIRERVFKEAIPL